MARPRTKRHNRILSTFIDEMIRSGHTFKTLAPITGRNHRTFSSWGLQTQPHIDQLADAFQAIGCRLVIVKTDPRQ